MLIVVISCSSLFANHKTTPISQGLSDRLKHFPEYVLNRFSTGSQHQGPRFVRTEGYRAAVSIPLAKCSIKNQDSHCFKHFSILRRLMNVGYFSSQIVSQICLIIIQWRRKVSFSKNKNKKKKTQRVSVSLDRTRCFSCDVFSPPMVQIMKNCSISTSMLAPTPLFFSRKHGQYLGFLIPPPISFLFSS